MSEMMSDLVPLREFGTQFLLNATITGVKNRAKHSDPIFGKQLSQYWMIASSDTEEKSKRFASVSYYPKLRWD